VRVLLDPVHAAPVLRSLEPRMRRRLRAALRLLGRDASGISTRMDVKRLDTDAGPAIYRLRIADWRVAFTVDDDPIVLRIFHRSQGYGWLEHMD
jgi:mRNA-degrading endonuclease RelE of RelBE toxin-antitoxin system